MSDPAVWGPVLVAVTVFVVSYGISRQLEALGDQRREQHHQVMDVLNSLPDEFDQLKTYLDRIDENTKPPSSAEDLERLGEVIEDALRRDQD